MTKTQGTSKEIIVDDTLVGLIRGTEIIHTLPSYLLSMPDNKKRDQLIGRTKLEKVIEVLTVVGEATIYYLLARKGIPAYYIPAALNSFDVFWYGMDKAIQATDNNLNGKVNWTRGALFEDNLPSIYRNLPF